VRRIEPLLKSLFEILRAQRRPERAHEQQQKWARF
jgi:hypothetical protein